MKSKTDEVLANWEAELFDSNQMQFTINSVGLIDKSDAYLRDKILPLYEAKQLEIQVAATVLTAFHQTGKRILFLSQKRLFRLYSTDPNRKESRKTEFNGEEYQRIYRYLERTCFKTIEESTSGIVRLPAIVQLKHLETLEAMNLKHGFVSRSDIGIHIDSAYEWRRKTCEKKNLKDPSKGYLNEEVEIDVCLDDIADADPVQAPVEEKNIEKL